MCCANASHKALHAVREESERCQPYLPYGQCLSTLAHGQTLSAHWPS